MTKVTKTAIFINGIARAGKDTVVEIFQQLADFNAETRLMVESISSIDAVRQALESIGVPVAKKTQEIRQIMALTGKVLEEESNARTNYVVDRINSYVRHHGNEYEQLIFFVHVREGEVMNNIRAHLELIGFDCYEVLVRLLENTNEDVSSVDNEDTIYNYWDYDYQINNTLKGFGTILADTISLYKDIVID